MVLPKSRYKHQVTRPHDRIPFTKRPLGGLRSHGHARRTHPGLRSRGWEGEGRGAGGQRWEKGRKTKNSPYKSSKRASQWYYHNDTGTNKNKNKRTQADTAGYAAKTRTATWPGHPSGSRPPSLRSRSALALALTRSIGNMEGYFVFGASNLGQMSPPRNR